MDTRWPHDFRDQPTKSRSRRSLLVKTLLAAAAGLLPASLVIDSAAAFRSLSGCKDKCDRLSGNCKSRCRRCCKKIYNGSKKRCNFGCGSIRPK
jgi:hypothetical protein